MNILLAHCHYRFPGGEDAVFAAEAQLLRSRGHSVTMYELANPAAGAPWHEKLLLPLRTLYNPAAVRAVRALIRQNSIDIVHVHNTLLVLSPAVFLAAAAEGVPAVQTLHNFRLFCPGGLLLRDGQVCEDCPRHGRLCAVRHRCYRGSRAQSALAAALYPLYRRAYQNVNLIALTEFDRQKYLEFNALRPLFDPARLYVKPNPVTVEAAGPVLPWAARENRIVYAGRLEENKGLKTAVEAWKLLGADAPELVVAGAGPLEAWARAQTAGLPVRFAGQLPRAELHALTAASRAALAPSLCYESFGLWPAEAHLLGTPVLASDIGNIGASVIPGADGLRFAPGEAAALAAAVRALDAASFDPAAIAAAAKARFDPAANAAALEEIYKTVLANGAGGRRA